MTEACSAVARPRIKGLKATQSMKQLSAQPNLVDQVRDAILQEIATGAL